METLLLAFLPNGDFPTFSKSFKICDASPALSDPELLRELSISI